MLQSASSSFEKHLSARTEAGHTYFSKKAQDAGLKVLQINTPLDLAKFPNAIVIGVATYSDPDMEFLNLSLDWLLKRGDAFVFDIDIIRSFEDLQQVLPTAPMFNKTPVLAEYENGKLSRFIQRASPLNALP